MIQDAIRARIEQFTSELELLVRQAAIESVTNALGAGSARSASPARAASPARSTAPGSPARSTAVAAAPAAGSSAKLSFKRQKGTRRSPEQLAAIDAAILASVKSHPGQGIESMGKTLGVPTDDLKLRVLNLVQSKKLKKTGVKRATKYHPV